MNQDASLNPQTNDDEMRPEYDFSKGVRGVHASRFSKLSSDEALVLGYWQGEGFEVGSFSTSEMRTMKTPDFRLSRNGVEAAYCEVKSFQRDNWLADFVQTRSSIASAMQFILRSSSSRASIQITAY
jgi:hypothetical protein